MSTTAKKELSFELDLLPVISVLAVCICFLLATAVWVLVGSVNLKQASGATGLLSDKTPLVVVSLSDSSVEVQLKNTISNHRVAWSATSPSTPQKMAENIARLKGSTANLNSAIVLSAKTVSYEKIISTLEVLKTQGFTQVGLSPL